MNNTIAGTQQKALAINRDPLSYGSFAENGAGQEVARWFFHVGGAAATVAKTISAYDMKVSTGLYGTTSRYVGRQRLEAMLDYEYAQLVERLGPSRAEQTNFFVFADTVATSQQPGTGRGWVGVRFQTQPRADTSEVIIHVHLSDPTAAQQQEALGVLGVNLLFGVLQQSHEPETLIGALLDDLSRNRVEIDMIKFSGPAFATVDNRLMSLQLVEQGLTDAAMFTAGGEVVQPSEVLYKKPILVERRSFHPPTKLTTDLLERAREQFLKEPGVQGEQPVVLAEMTLRNLLSGKEVDHADFLARTDILGTLSVDVLVSRFQPYYQLADYLSRYTDRLMQPTDTTNPDYYHKVVDCQWACPAHTDVPEYIRLIAQGRYSDAYIVNRESNVFPGILGRVCDRPCEPACRRRRVEDKPVAICRLKRVASDLRDDITPRLPKAPARRNGRRVACIGAGPASLTVANDLVPIGYDVVIFEQFATAGGLMRTNIPAFRLPAQVLDEEIAYSLFPALRVGYLVLPRALVRPFLAAKWAADRFSAPLYQEALAELITSGQFER